MRSFVFSTWFSLSLTALLLSCTNPSGNNGLDSDGDGVSVEDGDCNDADPNIAPGLPEVCDGIDNDCDGQVDEDFDDLDSDGLAGCAGDCDDNNADVRPGAIEQCDTIDNDCDGEIDEVSDLDGDGFSNCGGDCDDGNANVNPGVQEVCDRQDNNCDGNIDEGFDLDGDSFTVCGGDCDDNNENTFPGAVEVCDGVDNDCDNEVDEGFDLDGDGFTSCGGDCDDFVATVNPNAAEICDLRDNNCDAVVDEGFDADGDGVTPCGGDCNDNDPAVSFGFTEVQDGKDNDCNGLIDEIFADNDGDGFTEAEGDCDDFVFEVNPGAIEFEGNFVDDDCDGVTDEPLVPCDTTALNSNDPFDYAKAIGLCNGEVINAQFISGIAASRAIVTNFGTNNAALNQPLEGARMVLLSSGRADTSTHDNGTQFDNNNDSLTCISSAHPDPQGDPGACGAADPAVVCDKVELLLTIQVPTNAQSFSYQFQFFSSEYPTFRCTAFDDTFLALLDSQAFQGNISFDNNGNVVSVNNGFFDICIDDDGNSDLNDDGVVSQFELSLRPAAVPPNDCTIENGAALAGTGFIFNNTPNPQTGNPFSEGAGATTPLTTFSPVTPGEIITLRFIIFDEGDDILDSSVTIDNFRWGLDPIDGPITQQ